MSRLRLEHHRGQRRRCDATQARHHIERLLAQNWTQAQIARAARLAHHIISDVRRGRPIVAVATAYAILSVPIGPAPADLRDTDATGTMRRLRALVAIGYPIAQLAPRIGIYPTALGNIARGELHTVRLTTADTVALHYQQLICQPGPSSRARIEARKKGWHGPLAWDDIDDPNCQPETDGQTNAPRRHKAVIDLEVIARRTKQGHTAEEIAEEIGCHKRSVVRARSRIQQEKTAKAGLEVAA
jgi:transcriptional regulator with XRE-family HTH domain